MSEAASHTWTCSGCGRRVPLRVSVCHCGASRQQAQAARQVAATARSPRSAPLPSGWWGVWRSLPRDVKAITLSAVLVLLAGFAWLVLGPPPQNTTPPLLGYVERLPAPTRAVPPRPPFKLPWWK